MFVDEVTREGLEKRVLVGYHDSLHPSREVLLEAVERERGQVESIAIKFNYPKDPGVTGDQTRYLPEVGGAWLDLGVYCIRLLRQLGHPLGFSLFDATST